MLVEIIDNKQIGIVSISNTDKEQEFLDNNPTYIKTDFNFVENTDLYEFSGGTFNLVSNWEELKAIKEVERLAEIEANKPTFQEQKSQKIRDLHTNYQLGYDLYLSQYPKAEVESFPTKQKEAEIWEQAPVEDKNNPLLTPRISNIVGGDETKRIEFIQSVLAKLAYLSQAEGLMVSTRDAIKACATVEELDVITI